MLFSAERRMEAETYLSTGFGIRVSMESKTSGWRRFGELANVMQPGRLKGILVSPEYGTPFLTASQVFDIRPVPRKFLALGKMGTANECFVKEGTVLVTRSGSVGRPTIAHAPHRGIILSDDLLRVNVKDELEYGWVYAFLLAPQTRSMTKSAQYGHIIKHLETHHLEALPIPTVDDEKAKFFLQCTNQILELRDEGYRLTLDAEAHFEQALGTIMVNDWGEQGFRTSASYAFLSGRRRLDATVNNPGVAIIKRHLAENGRGFTTIAEAGYEVWLPNRFRRIPASDGVWLLDSADLTEVNPDITKRIADINFGDAYQGRVKADWILMARSGQTYGIIGTTILAGKNLEKYVISDHVMRIKPSYDTIIKPGYLVTAMSHPLLGRPIVKSLAYGSSIPEIDVADLANLEIVRLHPSDEDIISELAVASAKVRAEADEIERKIAVEAGEIIDRFISGF